MCAALLLLALDPFGLGIGIFLIIVSIASFVRRAEVAERLARSYAQRRSPSWAPSIFRKRFGPRETRIISVLLPALMAAVGCQQVIAALL